MTCHYLMFEYVFNALSPHTINFLPLNINIYSLLNFFCEVNYSFRFVLSIGPIDGKQIKTSNFLWTTKLERVPQPTN